MNNYLLYSEKGIFNCSGITIRHDSGGIFASFKDPEGNGNIEIPKTKCEIYFYARENILYKISINKNRENSSEEKSKLSFLDEKAFLIFCLNASQEGLVLLQKVTSKDPNRMSKPYLAEFLPLDVYSLV